MFQSAHSRVQVGHLMLEGRHGFGDGALDFGQGLNWHGPDPFAAAADARHRVTWEHAMKVTNEII
jgi:hypothetical protein